jgi:hypothetical protein
VLHYVHLVLVNAAAAGATDHQVLHGGAVERDGAALIFVAPSGGGKTTTALGLVRRGWRLLSDDFAVLSSGATVVPFPRRLNLTDDTLALLSVEPPPGAIRVAISSRGAKWMVDAEELIPGSVGRPAPLGTVIVLAPRTYPGRAASGSPSSSASARGAVWRLQLDHAPDGLEERLAAIPGVQRATTEASPDGAVVEIAVNAGVRIVGPLDAALAAFDVTALSVARPQEIGPEPFSRPWVEVLSATDAVRAILPHDLGLSGRRFLEGTRPELVAAAHARLTASLAAARGGIFQVWPGELEATLDTVEACAVSVSPSDG